jgi:Na+-driven multidrug efflux pump
LGNTRPALLSTATRLTTFAIPAVFLSSQPGFQIHYLWYLSVATVTLQAVVSFLLLRREFRRRLIAAPAASPVAA